MSLLLLQISLALALAIGFPIFLFVYLKGHRNDVDQSKTAARGANTSGRNSSVQWEDGDCRPCQLAGIVEAAARREGNG